MASVFGSIVQINSALTNPDAVQHWAGHEEGHNFCLGDCWFCGTTNTIMDEGEVDWDTDGGLLFPTDWDFNSSGAYSDWGSFSSDPTGSGGGDPGVLLGLKLMMSGRKPSEAA